MQGGNSLATCGHGKYNCLPIDYVVVGFRFDIVFRCGHTGRRYSYLEPVLKCSRQCTFVMLGYSLIQFRQVMASVGSSMQAPNADLNTGVVDQP